MLWEYYFLKALESLQTPVLNTIMAVLSFLGNGGLLWITLGVLLCIKAKTRHIGIDVLLSIVVTFIIGNLILKNVIDRQRPYEVYEALVPLITKPSDASFPSGHTMNGFTAATAVCLHKKKAGIAALSAAALIAFSRLYNQVHFPTDIMGGIVVGVSIAILVHVMMKKLHARQIKMTEA